MLFSLSLSHTHTHTHTHIHTSVDILSYRGLINSGSYTMSNSGSLEKAIGRGVGEMKLEGNVRGLYNPLAWENTPSSLQEKFPHWKDSCHSFSQSSKEDGSGEATYHHHCIPCAINKVSLIHHMTFKQSVM